VYIYIYTHTKELQGNSNFLLCTCTVCILASHVNANILDCVCVCKGHQMLHSSSFCQRDYSKDNFSIGQAATPSASQSVCNSLQTLNTRKRINKFFKVKGTLRPWVSRSFCLGVSTRLASSHSRVRVPRDSRLYFPRF
jgi:hypothetical protein